MDMCFGVHGCVWAQRRKSAMAYDSGALNRLGGVGGRNAVSKSIIIGERR